MSILEAFLFLTCLDVCMFLPGSIKTTEDMLCENGNFVSLEWGFSLDDPCGPKWGAMPGVAPGPD